MIHKIKLNSNTYNVVLDFFKRRFFELFGLILVGFFFLLQYLKKEFPLKKQIIFQPFNLPEMINIASNLGFKPNFIEQDIVTGQPNVKSLQKKISNKTLAVIVTNILPVFTCLHNL